MAGGCRGGKLPVLLWVWRQGLVLVGELDEDLMRKMCNAMERDLTLLQGLVEAECGWAWS